TTVVGRLRRDYGILVVEPEDRRLSQPLLVAPDGAGEALPGQVVVAEIVAQPSRGAPPVARSVEVPGGHTDPGMEVESAMRRPRRIRPPRSRATCADVPTCAISRSSRSTGRTRAISTTRCGPSRLRRAGGAQAASG